MVYRTIFNTSDHPVVVDELGHVVGGHEWGTVETTDEVAKPLLDSGTLIEAEAGDPSNDLDPRAVAAQERTEQTDQRATQASNASKEALENLARKNGLITGDESPSKGYLIAVLASSQVDLASLKSATNRAPSSKSSSEEKQEA